MTSALQRPLFAVTSTWSPTPVAQLPSWAGAKRVAIDIETCDPTLKKLGSGVRRGAFIAGVSFAIEDGPAFYLPMRHLGGDNLDPAQVVAYLRDQARSFRGTICGANLGQYDLDFLAQAEIEFDAAAWVRDVQIAEPLLDELADSYALDAIAKRYDLPGKDTRLLDEAGAAHGLGIGKALKPNLWKLPARYVAPYAIQDAAVVLQILRKQERRIDEEELWKVYDLESRLSLVLLRMKRRGVRFSNARLERVERWSIEEEQKALDKLYAETGFRVKLGDVHRGEVFEPILKSLGIEVPKTPKTGKPSITKEFLDSIEHPSAASIHRARKVNKIRTTFVESVRAHAIGDRLHPTYNQLRNEDDDGEMGGAAYGRISCEHVNLQQQPARDPEIGPLWRSIYIPEDGGFWVSADYSQQEPRVLTHYAELTNCRGARAAADRYRNDPSTDNHTLMAQMIRPDWARLDPKEQKKVRSGAKEIFLGRCYGMGDAKLCHKLGLPTVWRTDPRSGVLREYAGPEGRALIDQFNAGVTYVRELSDKCQSFVEKHGYIRTIGGRKCRFPKKEDGSGYDWVHKALNRLIQGSSADQTKQAMVNADAAYFPLALQVHDELDLTLQTPEEVEILSGIMREAIQLSVPMKVDAECGPSWGEAA